MKQQKRRIKPLKVMAQDAVRIAAGWLWERLPDRFGPSDPTLDAQEQIWRVPVVLAYPGVKVGEVGEILINASRREVVSHTEIAHIRAVGLRLAKKHRAKVRAAFLRTRIA